MDNNEEKPKSKSIFRQAAIDASFMQQYGKVTLLPQFSHLGLFFLSALFAVGGLVFISTQAFFETIDVQGWVRTTKPNIDLRSQESAGIVKTLLVTNGSKVKQGDTIAILARSKGEALGSKGIKEQETRIRQEQSHQHAVLQQKQDTLKLAAQAILRRQVQSDEQITQISQHQEKHQGQLKIAKQRWQSLKELLARGLISLIQVEQSELQMLSLHQQDFELFMNKQNIQTQRNELQQQLFANKQQQKQISHEMDLLNIKTQQQLDALINDTQMTVTAPSSGIIDNLQVAQGKAVAFNQVITQIAPSKPQYYVQLAIPSHQVAFLRKDQQVNIKVAGFAYQKYGSLPGVVSHISEQVIAPRDINGLTIAANQAVYLVNIDIDYTPPSSSKDEISLRSGMAISASVNKQETTILRWLLAPLFELVRPVFARREATL